MSDKVVIGLGESTHGTKEFNTYRAEFIKDKILHNNVRTVAVETDYCQSIILNDYLTSDLPNSKDSLLKKKYMTPGFMAFIKHRKFLTCIPGLKTIT